MGRISAVWNFAIEAMAAVEVISENQNPRVTDAASVAKAEKN